MLYIVFKPRIPRKLIFSAFPNYFAKGERKKERNNLFIYLEKGVGDWWNIGVCSGFELFLELIHGVSRQALERPS